MPSKGSSQLDRQYLPLCRQLVESLRQLEQSRDYSAAEEHEPLDEELKGDLDHLLSNQRTIERLIAPPDSIPPADECTDPASFLHELRNILNIIIGYGELLADEIAPQHRFQPLLRHLQHLCQQLLKLDTDKVDLLIQQRNQQAGHILVVDDQPESRDILRRHLEQQHFEVCEAGDGRQMFECLRRHAIDLILLDLILPEMDGDELLRALKQDEQLRAIPVIVVSGSTDNARILNCIEAGAEDYLNKPFNPTLLQARISAGIERKQWHDKEQQYRRELERNQQFIRSVFGRYLSEDIVNALLENPTGLDLGGSQRKVSVMMADIRSFTSIAEQLSPPRVVKLLNNYLGTMSDIIMQHGGTVDEFIGDAVLAIFGAPVNHGDNTERAVRCALAMQQAVAQVNQRNRQDKLPEIDMGISINTGNVVAGNIGSEKRAKYGVVGHTVNQTARIEDYCEGGSILISESTLKDCQQMLSIGNSFNIQAKGILNAFTVYQLTGIGPLKKPAANHALPSRTARHA